ncbi:EAL domain-containing protein [Cetobacterium sp. ZWU0022]|uniref:EAL domain-containing protein n=1 Tax=Cetobacterium sp. ZWU0022 TaxID=1340502 RepID=UPI000648EF21|nr:EAL domain-containing protein [Cetobacterium sp. ZWU0022]
MRKVFVLYFLLLTQIIFSANYIPKNTKEEKILESYKGRQLVLGLKSSDFDNTMIDGESLNSIIEEMLVDYLNLNIRVIKSDWNEVITLYKNKEIDIMGTMTQNEQRKESSVFSLPIYDDLIYISSSSKGKFDPNNLESLNGKEIYATESSLYIEYLEKFLKYNDIDAKIIEVKDSYERKDKIFLTSKYNVLSWDESIKVGYLPDVSIALKKELGDLIEIINNALLEKYQGKINRHLERRTHITYQNKFMSSLTDEEKVYLQGLSQISIALDSNHTLSYYSKGLNKFIGVIPFFIENLSKRTGIKFKIINDKNNNWNNTYADFLNKKIRIVPLPENKEWNKKLIFTKAIYTPTLYKISSFYTHNTKVGVVKGSVEETFARDFYSDGDIKLYGNYDQLEKALNRHEINTALQFDINKMDTSKFRVDEFVKIPISLALHEEDAMLTNILNKGIKNGLNLKKLEEEANIIKKQEAFNEYQKFQVTNKILYILLGISCLLGMASIYKILSNYKVTRELKKDLITGLPNRTEFLNFISKRKILKGYAITMDIDNFKEINDKYGQASGDYLLKAVGQCLKKIFPEQYIYRVSGDEFDVFVQEEFLIERLNSLKEELKALKLAYQLDLSIGYYKKNGTEDLENAFKHAYMAMEEAKKRNGTYYLEATEELLKIKKREYSIKSLLRNKDLSGLYAVYQPKFDIKTKRVIGGESLARWSDKELGFISPAEFIPIAEEINLIHLVDYKIADETIKFIRDLKENELVDDEFKLSFNLSMNTLERDDVVQKIKELLEKNDVLGKWLEVEITESIFSTNLKTTLLKIDELKRLGLSLAMDDFTAGHSTVSLLPLLPLEVVKFDKGILDAIGTKDNLVASNIYSAFIGLVKDLNVMIVAEGIETEAQLLFLASSNVRIGQGYIFSKPITKDEFEEKL